MISMRDLTVRYGDTVAVDHLDLDLPAGKIYGLLGRNGSGKTSLLSVLASYRRPSAGTITVDGVDPFENAELMGRTAFIRDTLDVAETDRIRAVLDFAAGLRSTFLDVDPDSGIGAGRRWECFLPGRDSSGAGVIFRLAAC